MRILNLLEADKHGIIIIDLDAADQMIGGDTMAEKPKIEIKDKPFLTLEEAVAYFGICSGRLRELTNQNDEYILMNGNKRLIKRKRLEAYLENAYVI